jgi:5'(3')-deoxyribonucleotidase
VQNLFAKEMLSVRKLPPQLQRKFEEYGFTPVELSPHATYEIGKKYWCGYWSRWYKVLNAVYQDHGNWKELKSVTVEWQNGEISTHCTSLDPKNDYELIERAALKQNGRAGESPARLFVDMDGTLAVFHPAMALEELYEPGYFAGLEPQENVLRAVRTLARGHPNIKVYTLSAVLSDSPYALEEKNAWLDRYLPEVGGANRLFSPYGTDKKSLIPGGIRSTDFLLDDYTHNLMRWSPGRGIKLLNAINHTRGTWQGDRIRYDKPPEEIVENLIRITQGGHVLDERPAVTRDSVLKEVQDQAWNNVMAYSKNYAMTLPKKGFEEDWKAALAKAGIVNQMVDELPRPEPYRARGTG